MGNSNPTTYIFEIDTQRTGEFAHTLDNVTAYVMNMSWFNGFRVPFGDVANANTLSIELNNADGRFDVDKATALYADYLKPSTLVRVSMTVSGHTERMWWGRISQVMPILGAKRSRPYMSVQCVDLMDDLNRFEYAPKLSIDVTTDEALDVLFDDAPVGWPYDMSSVLDYCSLDEDGALFDIDTIYTAENGLSTLPYAGAVDAASRKITATQYIADTVQQECGGRFFYDARSHKFIFQNRHHVFEQFQTGTVTVFDGDDIDTVNPRYADDVMSRILYEWTPRTVGTAGATLFDSTAVPFTLGAGRSRHILARYVDPNNENARVNATDVITPVKGVDILPNDANLSVEVEIGANSATFQLENTGTASIDITKLAVRGTPLIEYETETIEIEDLEAAVVIGRKSRSFKKRVQTSTLAEAHTNFLLGQFNTAQRRVDKISYTVRDVERAERARDLSVGHLVTVDDSAHSGFLATFVIVGEGHIVQGTRHEVSYILEPSSRVNGGALDSDKFGVLNENAYLMF